VLHVETKVIQSPYKEGLLLIRSPAIMRGYLKEGKGVKISDAVSVLFFNNLYFQSNRAGIDKEGWLSTGDMAFFDQQGNLYIKERANFMFRYLSHLVCFKIIL
jgi:long-subunit acyl-CoA synthetase (AMP-forming)